MKYIWIELKQLMNHNTAFNDLVLKQKRDFFIEMIADQMMDIHDEM